ncbi:MAG: HEAT repeat domain-containing protein [Candidatus Heimdallarchaeota archaeon]|nr:HEAT repeat domain-containing protein [Candidatus Heimdallarchaeota archaeon]
MSDNITKLLELSESDNKKDRKQAAMDMGELDSQFPAIMERLRDLSDNDEDRGVRKEAAKSLDRLATKPVAEAVVDDEGGSEDTAFDDEVGDSSLEAGEYDLESNLSDEEEDRIEAEATGKGLDVLIMERNFAILDYYGEVKEKLEAKGEVVVTNDGTKSRITGVDLELENVDAITSEVLAERIHIGLVAPGKDAAWRAEYSYEKEFDPIKVEQTYVDPETNVSPNFLGGEEKSFELRIMITNTLEVPIYNIKGEKLLNKLAKIGDMVFEGGEITRGSTEKTVTDEDGNETSENFDTIEFTMEEIEAGASAEVIINISAALPDDMEAYHSYDLNVTYHVKDELTSGLEFKSIDGVSNMKQRIRRKQREEEPNMFDCEILFSNKSEFIYDMNKFQVYEGDRGSEKLVLDWDGNEATEDEREIVPGEDIMFEFVFESEDYSTPQFGNFIDFSVQHEMVKLSENLLTLPDQDLKFMALEISKVYTDAEGNEITELEVESYRETPVHNRINLKGIGTFPIEGLDICEQIPPGFEPPAEDEIKVTRNGEEVSPEDYEYELVDDDEVAGGKKMFIRFRFVLPVEEGEEEEDDEEEESNGFKEGEEIIVNYTAIAMNPEPREDPIRALSYAEGYLNEAPDSKVRAETLIEGEGVLQMVVVHKRAEVDIAKTTFAVDYNGQNAYEIELEGENNGTSVENIVIEDLIPTGFKLLEDTITMTPEGETLDEKGTDEGQVYGWAFNDVEPDVILNIKFTVVEEDPDSDTRKLFTVYKG